VVNKKISDVFDVGALLRIGDAVSDYLGDPGDPAHTNPVYHFPTFDGLIDTINTKINAALQGALGVTPITITGGLFRADKELRFDVHLDLAKTISVTPDFGEGFAALGLDAGTS